MKNKIDLVVTRHPALVAFLQEEGFEAADVLTHATADDVRGKRVAGVLPLPLAAECASLVWVELRLSPEDRGKELSLDQMRSRVVGIREYRVSTVQS